MNLPMYPRQSGWKSFKEKRQGSVYVARNEHIRAESGGYLYKIGFTSREVDERLRELYEGHTGVPGEFEEVFSRECRDAEMAEHYAHKLLEGLGYRVNDSREFFDPDEDDAIRAVDYAVDMVEGKLEEADENIDDVIEQAANGTDEDNPGIPISEWELARREREDEERERREAIQEEREYRRQERLKAEDWAKERRLDMIAASFAFCIKWGGIAFLLYLFVK